MDIKRPPFPAVFANYPALPGAREAADIVLRTFPATRVVVVDGLPDFQPWWRSAPVLNRQERELASMEARLADPQRYGVGWAELDRLPRMIREARAALA